jgi:hypothetical protein
MAPPSSGISTKLWLRLLLAYLLSYGSAFFWHIY